MEAAENKSYIKGLLTILSGNSVSQIIPFFIAPILTRIFTPEDFAIYANFIAITSLFAIVAAGRFELAFVIPKKNAHAQSLFITSCIILLGVFLLSFLLYFFRVNIAEWYDTPQMADYMIWVPFGIATLAFHSIQENWMLRIQKFRLISFNKIIQSATANLVPILLSYLFYGINGLVYGWILANFVSIILFLPAIKKSWEDFSFKRRINKLLIYRYRDFPTINSLHAFTDVLATQFLIFWLITNEYGLLVLGLFSVMNKYIRAPIGLVSSAVSKVYYSEGAKRKREGREIYSLQKKTLGTTLVFAVPFVIVVIFFAPQLFAWYLGEDWRVAGEYAIMMVPALFFQFLASPISSTTIIFDQQKKAYLFTVIGYTVGFVVLLLMSYSKAPFEKTILAYSIAMSLYYLSMVLWFVYLSKKDLKHESIS